MSAPPAPPGRPAKPTALVVLGVLNIMLSVCCGFSSVTTGATPLFVGFQRGAMKSMIEQAQAESARAREDEIRRLEDEKRHTNDPQRRDEIDRSIERLKAQPEDVPDMMGMYDPLTEGSAPAFFIAYGVSGTIFNILLFISGIGLLGVARWSRRLAMVAAVLIMVQMAAYSAYNAFVLGPAMGHSFQNMMDQMNQSAPPGGPPMPDMSAFMALSSGFGSVIALILGCVWPVIILILLNTRDVKRAFGLLPQETDTFA